MLDLQMFFFKLNHSINLIIISNSSIVYTYNKLYNIYLSFPILIIY